MPKHVQCARFGGEGVPCIVYLLPNCAYCARLGVSTFHWFFICRQSVSEFLWDRLPASIQFPVMPKRAQYARFSGEYVRGIRTVQLYVPHYRYRKLPNSDPFGRGGKSIYPDPNPFQTPRIYIYIPAGDSGLFPATAEFLRITQDPNTESVARVSRARVRAGICVSR